MNTRSKLYKPYDTFVEPVMVKTYVDEPRIKESYRFIYEKLDTDAPLFSLWVVEIPQTIPIFDRPKESFGVGGYGPKTGVVFHF